MLIQITFHCYRNVDDVHNMMDDIAESQDLSKEISEAISNPVALGLDVDEVRLIIYLLIFQFNNIKFLFITYVMLFY